MAFGRLKARWRRLNKRLTYVYVGNIPNIVLSCSILHNIHEIHGDGFIEEWIEDSELDQPDDTTSPGWRQ